MLVTLAPTPYYTHDPAKSNVARQVVSRTSPADKVLILFPAKKDLYEQIK